MTTTTTLPQPFASQQPAAPCEPGCRQGVQIVPVAGNNERPVSAFVVYHGRGHLDPAGAVTSTPVHLTYAEADTARRLHAEGVADLVS